MFVFFFFFFFFNDTATTEIYTLSLHDALPISMAPWQFNALPAREGHLTPVRCGRLDRKSTRLNSSHRTISYAVFCLKKKKKKTYKKTLYKKQYINRKQYTRLCTHISQFDQS